MSFSLLGNYSKNFVSLSAAIIAVVFAIFCVSSFVYFHIALGNRLMLIGDDWSEINYYVGFFRGDYNLLNILDHAGSTSMNKQSVTRLFMLYDLLFGNGTVMGGMVRAMFYQLASASLLSYAVYRARDVKGEVRIFFIAIIYAAFCSPFIINLTVVTQSQGWLITIFFTIVAICLLGSYREKDIGKLGIVVLYICGIFSLFAWTNGLLYFPILALIFYKNGVYKSLSVKLRYSLGGIIVITLYAYFQGFAAVGSGNLPFYKQPINFMVYFVQLLGDPFSNLLSREIGGFIGCVILLGTLFQTYRYFICRDTLDFSESVLFGTILFLAGSLCLTAMGRIGWSEAGGMPPLRYGGVAILLWPILLFSLMREARLFFSEGIVLFVVFLFSFLLFYSFPITEKFSATSKYYNNISTSPERNNIALAIGGGSISSLHHRGDFRREIPPLIPDIEKYNIGPFSWYEKKWLHTKITDHIALDNGGDCKGKAEKIYHYYDHNNSSLGFDGIVSSKDRDVDLIVITNDSNIVVGLGVTVNSMPSFRDYIFQNRLDNINWYGASLWNADDEHLFFFGVDKGGNLACKFGEMVVPNQSKYKGCDLQLYFSEKVPERGDYSTEIMQDESKVVVVNNRQGEWFIFDKKQQKFKDAFLYQEFPIIKEIIDLPLREGVRTVPYYTVVTSGKISREGYKEFSQRASCYF